MGTILKNGVNYSGSSGGGGVSSYNELTGKPQIEGVTLSGNKTASDLGLVKASDIPSTDSFYSTSDTAFTDLADADYVPMYDSSASTKKKTLWSNIKSVLKTYFDSLYQKTLTAGTNISFSGTGNTTINASMPVLGTINRSDIYDTTEKVVGKWTDGRPLYQRTYTGTSNSSGNATTVATLSNARIYKMSGVISNTSTSMANSTTSINIPVCATPSSGSGLDVSIFAYYDTSAIYLTVAETSNAYRNKGYAITVQYTKTTDAANSYNYSSENDYSTSEKIIGTWTDGQTLYQRVLRGTVPTCSTNGTEVLTTVASVTSTWQIRSLSGVFYKSFGTTTQCVPFPIYMNRSNVLCSCRITVDSNGNIQIGNSDTTYNGRTAEIIIKYTK